jgi:hypothetical protein
MKGVLKAPDGKRPHPPRTGETEGIRLKGRHSRDTRRHEGLAPVRCKSSKPVRALLKAGVFLPHVGSIALSFRGSSVPGLMTRGCSADTGSRFSCSSGSAANRSDGNAAQASHKDAIRDLKNRASPSLPHETEGTR